ncbi:MAG: Zn-dependent hydrolase [Thermomicrobiales bacterium]|nr:Zn-dependent hydrolase [Thermomicrobiales bacterium]
MEQSITVDPGMVEHYLTTLAQFGAYGETGVKRLVYSPEWVAAQEQVQQWCREVGLDTRMDGVGNVWGRIDGSEGGASVVSGSHIDSQAPGGRFDGALGVVAALSAVRTLVEQFGQPKRPLEVLSFCEEESSRFASTNFWGSRAITGRIMPNDPDNTIAFTGETMAEAMREVGLDPAKIPEAKRSDIDTFIELHIEQGPILEQMGLPVGIVTAITGLRHYVVELTGRSDHAGARPMDTRRDPMPAAAEIITDVITTALRFGRPAVTTIGNMQVEPNLPAAVPDKVTFMIDARHPDPEVRKRLFAKHERTIEEVAARHDIDVSWRVVADHDPCISDPGVVAALEEAAQAQGIAYQLMHSGAGHDTQRMAKKAKVAMIFVPSQGGRSHTPAEFTSIEDMMPGINVLANALYRLAY